MILMQTLSAEQLELVIDLALAHEWPTYHMNVEECFFLNDFISEEVC